MKKQQTQTTEDQNQPNTSKTPTSAEISTGLNQNNANNKYAYRKTTLSQAPKNNANLNSDFAKDLKEIYDTFQEVKEIININTLLQCIKNIAALSKNCTNPLEKLMLIIQQISTLSPELTNQP